MTIVTRDDDVPAEVAALFEAFERCAGGHTIEHVLIAASNMLSHAAIKLAISRKLDDGDAVDMADDVAQAMFDNFVENWERRGESRDGDVPVNPH